MAAERTVEVGHARAVVRPHDHRKGYVVEKVWVDPEHRGNGAARRLMREISDKFRRHDLWLKPRPYSEMGAELGATIDQLKRFYRSLGFEPADEKDNMLRPASREKRAYARAREAKVPRVDELPSYCGPAALKSVMGFHGVEVGQRRLGRLAGTTVRDGTSGAGMRRAARRFGFDARVQDGATLDRLRNEVAKGRPAIVNWWSEDDGHYSVVERVGDRGVHMMDPETARARTVDRTTFERNWFDFERSNGTGRLVRRRMITIKPAVQAGEKQAAIVAPIALKNMRLGAQLDDALKPYQDDARTFLRSLDDVQDARERAKAREKVAELYKFAAFKEAATLQQLRAGVARLPGVVESSHPVVQAFGGMVLPTRAQLKGRGKSIMMGMQRKLMGSENFDALQAAAKDLEHPSLRGKILHSGNMGAYMHPSAPPDVQQGLHTTGIMHEALERTGRAGQGLHTLGTETKDFNLVSRLRGGPLEDQVRGSMMELRAPEYAHLQHRFSETFKDPRASEFVTEGGRIPKAMRKAYAREMRPYTHTTVPEAAGIMSEQAPVVQGRYAEVAKVGSVKRAEKSEDGEHELQGHIDFQGLDIAVENRKGSVRSGKKPDGGTWRTVMKAPYGYIEAPAKGKDGESVDVYVGPKKDAPVAYVVHQHKPNGTGHDEDKVILGTESEEEAKRLYLQHYDDPKFLGPVSAVPVDRLKQLLEQKKRLTKISGVAMGAVAAPFKAVASGGFNPAKNVQSLAQRWKPPKVSAPSVQSLPGMPKLK